MVLFAKKKGIKGITFATTNKYFKARKAALQMKMAEHATQRSSMKAAAAKSKSITIPIEMLQPQIQSEPQETKRRNSKYRKPSLNKSKSASPRKGQSKRFIPTTIRTKGINSGNNKPLPKNDNVRKYRRSKKLPSVSSPIIDAIKNEKKIDDELSKINLNGRHSKRNSKINMNNIKTKSNVKKGILKTPKRESRGSTELPYWSVLNIGTPKELEGNQLKMAEIKEDVDDKAISANFFNYTKDNNVDFEQSKRKKSTKRVQGSSTPATPGSIKSNPTTPTSSYWTALDSSTLDLNALVADTDISLRK